VAGKVALGVAANYALEQGLDAIFKRVQSLAARLRERLADLPGVTVYDRGRVQGGITTFTAAQMDAATIQHRLRALDINTSVSPPSSTRLDATQRDLPPLVRASVHYYNTEDEIARFCTALRDVLQNGR
jgi:selenocysteine lyase/cysteine desulfurase